MRNILSEFLRINHRWETRVLESYQDKDQKWHAGWGTGPEMAAKLGITIDAHTVLTPQQADELHTRSLNEFFAPEMEKHLAKAGIETNDHQFNALLDVLYNRGACRLIGCDPSRCKHQQGTPDWHKGSYAWHMLQQKDQKWFMEEAAKALVFSHVDDWTPLDEAYDKALAHDRGYLGLVLRRIDDSSLFGFRA